MLYALILAGGSGMRFWPLSRDAKPKQLIDLFGEGTLLEQSIARAAAMVDYRNILVLTNAKQAESVKSLASMLPAENIIIEPTRRDTAPAIALGCSIIAARDSEATVMILPSDQLIGDTAAFKANMQTATALAEERQALVTLGIKPTWPCPSYGYIEQAKACSDDSYFRVERFREKPSPEVAAQFLAQGNYVWNAGMFVWKVSVFEQQLLEHCAQLGAYMQANLSADCPQQHALQNFAALDSISIDFALMEKADCVFNVAADFDWDDVGSWLSLAKYLPQSQNNNSSNPLTSIGSQNNIVYATDKNKQVALLDVDDLIIVDSADALLVAKRDSADAIKNIVQQLPEHLR